MHCLYGGPASEYWNIQRIRFKFDTNVNKKHNKNLVEVVLQ